MRQKGRLLKSSERQTAVHVTLTAAVLVGAVRAIWLFVTLVTGRDAGAITQAFKLLRSTPVIRTLGGCDGNKMEIYNHQV